MKGQCGIKICNHVHGLVGIAVPSYLQTSNVAMVDNEERVHGHEAFVTPSLNSTSGEQYSAALSLIQFVPGPLHIDLSTQCVLSLEVTNVSLSPGAGNSIGF